MSPLLVIKLSVETVAFICEPVGSRVLKPIQNQPCSLIQPQAGLRHCGGPPTQIYRCRALCVGRGMECGSPVGSRPGAWLRCSSHSHSTLGAARLGCVYLFPTPWSVTSCWELGTSTGRWESLHHASHHTLEIRAFAPESQLLNIY